MKRKIFIFFLLFFTWWCTVSQTAPITYTYDYEYDTTDHILSYDEMNKIKSSSMPVETINKITADILAKAGVKVAVNRQHSGVKTRGLRERDPMTSGGISQDHVGSKGVLISTSKEKDKVFTQMVIKVGVILKMAGGSKSRGKRNRNVSFQYGGGQSLSMPNLAGNFHFRRKKANKRNKKRRGKRGHGMKKAKSKRKYHTQIPLNEGFISKNLRNRPTKRPKPTDGIVNDLPPVQQRPSQLRPQQLSWGN